MKQHIIRLAILFVLSSVLVLIGSFLKINHIAASSALLISGLVVNAAFVGYLIYALVCALRKKEQ